MFIKINSISMPIETYSFDGRIFFSTLDSFPCVDVVLVCASEPGMTGNRSWVLYYSVVVVGLDC